MPKALVPIGDMPAILHLMKIYAHYGFRKFILALGYGGDDIKQYFANYTWMTKDFRFQLKRGLNSGIGKIEILEDNDIQDLEIIFAETGSDTNTGGRIKKVEKYIEDENFMATYSDGLADINLQQLLQFHLKMGKTATFTAVHPMSQFGVVEIDNGLAVSFKEKPALSGVINGGFFVFNRRIFDYLNGDSILEEEPLRELTEQRHLAAYMHEGFGACMDTPKDAERLNKLWQEGYMPNVGAKFGRPPWKVWG